MSERPKTAYEQSIETARAMLTQAATDEEKQAMRKMDVQTMHKKAFRVAFDLLKELYPPKNDAEYWTFAAKRVSLICDDNKDNPLCRCLLLGLYDYLEGEVKKEMTNLERKEEYAKAAAASPDVPAESVHGK